MRLKELLIAVENGSFVDIAIAEIDIEWSYPLGEQIRIIRKREQAGTDE